MNQQEREQFVAMPHTAVLATVWDERRAHAVPVWYLYRDGAFNIITGSGSQKLKNIERTGRATLTIDQRDGVYRYVTVEGPVEVRDGVNAVERFELWKHYRGEEEARRVTAAPAPESMVMLTLRPE